METKNKSLKKYDAGTMACINSAYEDLQLMIKEIFTNVKEIPNQLSYEEFVTLFEKYDWQDLISKIEDLNAMNKLDDQKSIVDYLDSLLKNDTSIRKIDSCRNNSYYLYC